MPAPRIHLDRSDAPQVVPERGLVELRNADGDYGTLVASAIGEPACVSITCWVC